MLMGGHSRASRLLITAPTIGQRFPFATVAMRLPKLSAPSWLSHLRLAGLWRACTSIVKQFADHQGDSDPQTDAGKHPARSRIADQAFSHDIAHPFMRRTKYRSVLLHSANPFPPIASPSAIKACFRDTAIGLLKE